MSAFVAFNGFPGQDVRDPIAPILVHEAQTTVPAVPTEPARAAALSSRTARGSAATHAGSRRARLHGGPSARTVPISGPRNSAPVQTPSGGQGPVPAPQAGDLTKTADGVTQPLTGSPPSVPGTQLPSVSVPEVQVPSLPQNTLPVDTSGVTNGVNNLLGG